MTKTSDLTLHIASVDMLLYSHFLVLLIFFVLSIQLYLYFTSIVVGFTMSHVASVLIEGMDALCWERSLEKPK